MSSEDLRTHFASRVPYRTTSGAALGTLVALIVWSWLAAPRPALQSAIEAGRIEFNPCAAWEQMGSIDKLSRMVGFFAFLVFVVQGLRNRTGPRFLAMAGLCAIPLAVLGDWWRIRAGCYSAGGMVSGFTWLGSVSLMFLHHAVQPRRQASAEYPQLSRFGKLCYDFLFPAFVVIPIIWAILNQFRVMTYDGAEAGGVYSAILTAQQYVEWAGLVLAPFAGGVALHWLVVRLRRIVRVEPNP